MSAADPVKHGFLLILIMSLILVGAYHMKTHGMHDANIEITNANNNGSVVDGRFVHKENGYCVYTYNSAFAMHYLMRGLSEANNPSYLSKFKRSIPKYLKIKTVPETWEPRTYWSVFEYVTAHYHYDFNRTPRSNPKNCDVTNFPYLPHQLLTIREGVCFDYAILWAMVYAAYGKTGTVVYLAFPGKVGHAFFVYNNTFVGEDEYIYTYKNDAIWTKGVEWHNKSNWTKMVLITVIPGGPLITETYNWKQFQKKFKP